MPANEDLFAKFDALGAEQVRMHLATGVYLGADASMARAWLERRSERSSSEQILLARRATTEAHKANTIATAALVIAAISMILSAIAFMVPYLRP